MPYKDPEYQKKYQKHWHTLQSPEYKKRQVELAKARRISDPRIFLYESALRRKNLPFDLSVEDIIIPEMCPVFKVPMIKYTQYAPSVDRVDNSLGYTKDNIQIISRKANVMKNSASKEELIKFAQWILKD